MSRFSERLHGIGSFSEAKVQSAVLHSDEGRIAVCLVTGTTYTQEDRNALDALMKDMVPSLFTYELDITMVKPDCDIVGRRVYELAKEMSPMISATLEPDDVKVALDGDVFDVTVCISGPVPSEEKQSAVRGELSKSFCCDINVAFAAKESDGAGQGEERKSDYVVNGPVNARTFKIVNFKPIESRADEIPAEAVYIQDAVLPAEEVVLCGIVTSAESIEYEKKTTGKKANLFAFRISDGTATARITCFPRKPSLDHIAAIKEGDSIVCTCSAEVRDGGLSFKTKRIDYGSAPDGFVPVKKQSKPVPASYEHIKPEPYFDETQTDLFTDRSVPDSVKDSVYVVVDIETTGKNSVAGDMMDRIIELAACKIEGGEITESFSTLINPERKLSSDIIALTGIKDEMLEGAPVYEDVMPDFFRFCDGACLVGHNIEGFDIKFLDYYWETVGYIRENRVEDTLDIAHRVLPGLKNYKLPTIGEAYGYTFGKDNAHHRAINDTVVTAKIFLDLKRAEAAKS